MKKEFFLMLVILLVISCREGVINDEPIDILYLKSASADEERVIYSTGTETYRFPNDVLFKIPAYGNTAVVLNNTSLLVEDYTLIFPNEASFTFNENNNVLTVKAEKLPFTPDDYGIQLDSGNEKFNGILKSGNFVFSVKIMPDKIKIKVLDLEKNLIVTDNIASVSNGALTFKVGDEIWKMWLTKISPRGNIFQLYNLNKGGATSICYSLYLTK